MARTTNTALASWEFPKKSGIRIREVLNQHGGDAFGASYLVTIPAKATGKGRERKQFKNRPDAEAWADKAFRGQPLTHRRERYSPSRRIKEVKRVRRRGHRCEVLLPPRQGCGLGMVGLEWP